MTQTNVRRYFIADIHLSEATPKITDDFVRFLQQLPDQCELYILGDLFDYWVGDDAQTALHHNIADHICSLSLRRIGVFYIRGNRDFLLGKDFAEQCHMKILPDVYILKQGTKTILITHGDALCTHDKSYLRYRRIIRNSVIQNLFLFLPLSLRRKIADNLRKTSSKQNQSKEAYKMDVNPVSVGELMEKYQADILIQGHTHKPGQFHLNVNGKNAERFVLGAWHDDCDYVVAQDSIKLIAFKKSKS